MRVRLVVPTSRSKAPDFAITSGNTEGTADLDQLAAGYHYLAAFGKGIERQQNRRSVIVHHNCGILRGNAHPAEEAREPTVGVHVPPAAFTGSGIEFQIGIRSGRPVDVLQRRRPQGRSAQIGVQNNPGGIDHRAQRIAQNGS